MPRIYLPPGTLLSLAIAGCAAVQAASNSAATSVSPDFGDIAYGEHPRQRMDVYLPPDIKTPAPVVFYIHGGGWVNGDKRKALERYCSRITSAGAALVSINYRFLDQAKAAGIYPPVLGPLDDSARALQTLRHDAARYGIDHGRIALMGESAGAFTALWLGLGDERARADSSDPIARESTRVLAIGVNAAQTSIDPAQMRAWVGPELAYGPHAFGLKNNAGFEEFLARRAEFAPWIAKLSPAALLSPDDPPVFLFYHHGLTPTEPLRSYFTHSPRFGIGFKEEADRIGVPCTMRYEGQEKPPPGDTVDFLLRALQTPLSSSK